MDPVGMDELARWYRENAPTYDALAKKCEGIIRDVLDIEGVEYQDVTSRLKSLEGFLTKGRRYQDAREEVHDLAGIRIITYVDSAAKRAAGLIRSLFEIVETVDKSAALGVDRVGYRSIHYIATIPAERAKLHEYKRLAGMKFEVQVCTILAHAWAEIEHDRRYKYAGTLPDELKRRFSVLAGQLEAADREFDNLDHEVKSYSRASASELAGAANKTTGLPITEVTLQQFLLEYFPLTVHGVGADSEYVKSGDVQRVIADLAAYGIETLDILEHALPEGFDATVLECGRVGSHLVDAIPLALVVADPERYFAGGKVSLATLDANAAKVIERYGIHPQELVTRYGLVWIPF